MGMRCVGPARLDADVPAIRGGEQRPRSRCDLADRNARLVMQGKHRIAWKFGEQPLLYHDPAAAPALFGWLKDQMNRAFEAPGCREIFGGAQQHCCVPVMPAGVHLPVVGRAMVEVVQLVDR